MRALVGILAAITLLGATPALTPAAGPEEQLRFAPAEVVSTAEATYPANTVIGGTVVLQVTVDERGAIADVRPVRSLPPFTDEAIRTVKKWKFRPALLGGEPVESPVTVAFTFVPPALQATSPQ